MPRITLRRAGALSLLILVGPSRADVIPPGYKTIRWEASLTFVPALRERLETVYEIREGDTLGAIAERELGATDRAAEILARNAGLDPTQLAIGRRILLPPRVREPEEPFPYVFLAWSMRAPGLEPQLVRPGDPMPVGRYGMEILAIPKERLATLRDAKDPERFDVAKIEALANKIGTGGLHARRTVATADPTASISSAFTIHGVRDGKVLLVQKHTSRNASGKVVRVVVDVNDGSLEDAKRDAKDHLLPVLLPFAFTGGLGLIWLAFRRRRGASPDTAGAPA